MVLVNVKCAELQASTDQWYPGLVGNHGEQLATSTALFWVDTNNTAVLAVIMQLCVHKTTT